MSARRSFAAICENGTRTNYWHRLERKRVGNIGLHRDCRTQLLSCDLIPALGTVAGLTRTLQGAANFGFGAPGSQARCIILLGRHDGAAVNPGYYPVNESGRFPCWDELLPRHWLSAEQCRRRARRCRNGIRLQARWREPSSAPPLRLARSFLTSTASRFTNTSCARTGLPIDMTMKSWSAGNCGRDPTSPIRCPSNMACANTIMRS